VRIGEIGFVRGGDGVVVRPLPIRIGADEAGREQRGPLSVPAAGSSGPPVLGQRNKSSGKALAGLLRERNWTVSGAIDGVIFPCRLSAR
jgi:hypothetical protein